jgi:hypothetical protein
MAPGVPLRRIEERTLEVIAWHHNRSEFAPSYRTIESGKSGSENAGRGCNQCWQTRGHTGGKHGLKRVIEPIRINLIRIEVDAGEAIDLEIKEAGAAHLCLNAD